MKRQRLMSQCDYLRDAQWLADSTDDTIEENQSCYICRDEHPKSAVVSYGPCGCKTYPQCMVKYLQAWTDLKKYPVSCGFCLETLDTQLCLDALRGTPEADALESLSLFHDHIKSLRYCSNPRCATPFDFEETLCSSTRVQCTLCKTVSCVSCNTEWHEGVTCEEMELENALSKLAREKKWQKCPSCSGLIELVAGCSHVECICGCNFCYKCGNPYEERCTCMLDGYNLLDQNLRIEVPELSEVFRDENLSSSI